MFLLSELVDYVCKSVRSFWLININCKNDWFIAGFWLCWNRTEISFIATWNFKVDFLIYKGVYCISNNVNRCHPKISFKILSVTPCIIKDLLQVVNLPLKRKQSQVYIDTKIAQKIVPVEVKPGISLSTITGTLNVKDNVRNIQVCWFYYLSSKRERK